MAGRITEETRENIIRDFNSGSISKARLARNYGISVSTVNRILSSQGGAKKTGDQKLSSGNSEKNLMDMVSEKFRELSMSSAESGGYTAEYLIDLFLKWIRDRDEAEKVRIKLSSEIDDLKARKVELEEEIESLTARAARVEIIIGRMKSEAQSALDALSLAQEKVTDLENRLIEDRETTLMAAGLKWILDHEDVDDRVIDFMSRFQNLWFPSEKEIRIRLREIFIQHLEKALSKLKVESVN